MQTKDTMCIAADSTSGRPQKVGKRHGHDATPTEQLPPGWMLTRTDAAWRCGGYSRSWLTRFLHDYADSIPADFRPDAQLVVNRVPVEFVRWFIATGRRLPRRPKGPSLSAHTQQAA